MSRSLPTWLTAARRGHSAYSPTAQPGQVNPGDICHLALAADDSMSSDGRLVLVIDTDETAELASAVLVHTDYELRTDRDVLLSAEEAGLPFSIVIETDVVAPLHLPATAGTKIGRLVFEVELLREATQTGEMPAELLDRVGVPLRGRSDARWRWKETEGDLLARVADAYAQPPIAVPTAIEILAEAFRSIGKAPATDEDDLLLVSRSLLAFAGARQALPANILPLVAAPGIANAIGHDLFRAIEPILQVA